jgi:hypothetical protein
MQQALKLCRSREHVDPASDMTDRPPHVPGELIRSVHVQKNDRREVLKTAASPQEKNFIAEIKRHAKTRTLKINRKPGELRIQTQKRELRKKRPP